MTTSLPLTNCGGHTERPNRGAANGDQTRETGTSGGVISYRVILYGETGTSGGVIVLSGLYYICDGRCPGTMPGTQSTMRRAHPHASGHLPPMQFISAVWCTGGQLACAL